MQARHQAKIAFFEPISLDEKNNPISCPGIIFSNTASVPSSFGLEKVCPAAFLPGSFDFPDDPRDEFTAYQSREILNWESLEKLFNQLKSDGCKIYCKSSRCNKNIDDFASFKLALIQACEKINRMMNDESIYRWQFFDMPARRANASGANFSGVDLKDAHLKGGNFESAIYDDSTVFPPGFDPQLHGFVRADSNTASEEALHRKPRRPQ